MKNLTRPIFAGVGRQVVIIFLSISTVVFVARHLGPIGNGAYNLALLLPIVLSMVLSLGVPSANAYFVGRDPTSAPQAMASTLTLWVGVSLIGLLSGWLALNWSHVLFPGVPTSLLLIAIFSVPFVLLNIFMNSLLQGLQEFALFNRVAILNPGIALMVAIIFVPRAEYPVAAAAVAYVSGHAVSAILSLWVLRGIFVKSIGVRNLSAAIGRHLSYGWKAHLANVAAFLSYRIDVIILNIYIGPAAVGIYAVAVQVVERLWLVAQVVSSVSMPELAARHARDAPESLTPQLSRGVATLTAVGALGLAILGSPLIKLALGPDYARAYPPLLMLLPGALLVSCTKVLANDLAARGRPLLNGLIATFSLVLTVVVAITLIPMLGLNGAALALSLAYTAQWALTLRAYTHLSGTKWASTLFMQSEDIARVKGWIRTIRKPRSVE